MGTKCFLDMDGVISDFVFGFFMAHQCDSVYRGNPKSLGIFDIEKIMGITLEEFWAPIKRMGPNFWVNLPKTPEADEIVDVVCREFGPENVCILTNPSQGVGAEDGKREWIKKYYPQFSKRIIFGEAKEFLAGPDKLLIDDRDRNIDDFVRFGGEGILIPRLWNRRYQVSDLVINVLKTGLKGRKYGRV